MPKHTESSFVEVFDHSIMHVLWDAVKMAEKIMGLIGRHFDKADH